MLFTIKRLRRLIRETTLRPGVPDHTRGYRGWTVYVNGFTRFRVEGLPHALLSQQFDLFDHFLRLTDLTVDDVALEVNCYLGESEEKNVIGRAQLRCGREFVAGWIYLRGQSHFAVYEGSPARPVYVSPEEFLRMDSLEQLPGNTGASVFYNAMMALGKL